MAQLQQGAYHPVYLIEGEENYYLDQVYDYFEHHILEPGQQDFNLHRLEGKEVSLPDLLALASRYPVFADRQVIIIREASQMSAFKDLSVYLDRPNESTILALFNRQKKADGKTKFVKAIKGMGGYLPCDKLRIEQVPAWIQQYGKSTQIQIGEKEAQILTSFLGDDLCRIVGEIEKLRLNLKDKTSIDAHDIQQYIGVSRDFNAFEFPEAYLLQQKDRYYRMLAYFMANPKSAPFPLLIGSFYSLLSRVYLVGFAQGNSDREKANSVGISSYQWPMLQSIHRNWTHRRIEELLLILSDYSAMAVGIGAQMADKDLLAEWVGRMDRV